MRKKIVSLFMTAVMAGTLLCGCTGADTTAETGSNKGENDNAAESSEKKEISISILERGKCGAEEGNMEANRWVEWINENSPVRVKWVPIPRTESIAKTNALFASDSAPDLVWEFGKGFMDGLIQQGVIQPVDQYVDQYSTTYKQYLSQHSELIPYITGDDGQMYAFTSARTPLTIANYGLWIRQDWLDTLGLKTPATMDELYETARQFTENDPDQNGQADTFGLTFNYNFPTALKNMYGQPDSITTVQDGKLVDWVGSEAYAACFEMIKKMYNEGLIDPEYITDTNFERQRQLLVTGKAGIYMASYSMESEWRELKTNVPEAQLVPLEPVEGPYGKFGLYQEPPANKIICMNKNASDPEACIEFLDWMLDEGWMGPTYGIEGEHYNLVENIPQKTDADKFKKEVEYASEYAILSSEVIDDTTKYFQITSAQDEISQSYASIRATALDTAMKNPFRRDIPYLPSTELSSKYNSDFNPILTSIEAKMITTPGYSVQDGIEEINSEKKGLGFEAVMEERQNWYDNNKDIFN